MGRSAFDPTCHSTHDMWVSLGPVVSLLEGASVRCGLAIGVAEMRK